LIRSHHNVSSFPSSGKASPPCFPPRYRTRGYSPQMEARWLQACRGLLSLLTCPLPASRPSHAPTMRAEGGSQGLLSARPTEGAHLNTLPVYVVPVSVACPRFSYSDRAVCTAELCDSEETTSAEALPSRGIISTAPSRPGGHSPSTANPSAARASGGPAASSAAGQRLTPGWATHETSKLPAERRASPQPLEQGFPGWVHLYHPQPPPRPRQGKLFPRDDGKQPGSPHRGVGDAALTSVPKETEGPMQSHPSTRPWAGSGPQAASLPLQPPQCLPFCEGATLPFEGCRAWAGSPQLPRGREQG